ncbi:heavy-metal-associated domain-containing protein [Phocea massiliensis]|uniref:Heavy-metal-associated domain-containing protein n=1 Tax=Merdimmobilis hominis TaxID=2897707 RepID=A0A938X3C8_9FIRM|nr:heavy metal-associated domain-containing protein [Merdimmobilis hominis]MBM6920072.1 heavy-metal-associated domain-containing protein [Merdimmobilis hominis]
MKQTFKMENLDCANCAAKMEAAIAKIDGVEDVSISFLLEKMTLEADESRMDDILKKAQKACKKVDADCRIVLP